MSTAELHAAAPDALVEARLTAHNAVQIAALAALANIAPRPDYSHTALHWDAASGGFETGSIDVNDGPWFIRVTLSPLAMWLVRGGETVDTIDLNDTGEDACIAWLDDGLAQRGLKPASAVKHPFKLPKDVVAVSHFDTDGLEADLQVLSRWYDLANHELHSFAEMHRDIAPGPGPVYCWPHHFDIATYVELDAGGGKDARGVGVGMSPGDGSYGEPYFYVNPWPRPDAAKLPSPPVPGRWHTEGFVGAVATASDVLGLSDVDAGLADFIEAAFAAGRAALEG